ncbi:MAG: cell wall metabolism sensor histidine kinase WalK [Cyanobacteria bacterium]|nr:cell wall metabolism sensor histidine kinase WalK [Cyanobacteriota bacterium]
MNEELQSTNEELETMNEELREVSKSLSTSNKFLSSILSSIDSAVIAVNNRFEVILWNDKSYDLWGVRAEEVLSRSLLELDIGLPVSKLTEQIGSFTGGDNHKELILDARNRRGKQIKCIVKITHLLPDKDGCVIMIDV